MKSMSPWMVRVRSTAHFFVFIIGVSPTAFSRMSTVKEKKIQLTQSKQELGASMSTQSKIHLTLHSALWIHSSILRIQPTTDYVVF